MQESLIVPQHSSLRAVAAGCSVATIVTAFVWPDCIPDVSCLTFAGFSVTLLLLHFLCRAHLKQL